MTLLDQAIATAHTIRAELLRYDETDRRLTGQCGLASMLLASMITMPVALRTGFYMKHETVCGRRGRYPYRHAWCRVGLRIVDLTATQFDRRNKAVHVVRFDEDTRYIEHAQGDKAVDDIMDNWKGRESDVYAKLARALRGSDPGGSDLLEPFRQHSRVQGASLS